MFQEKESSNFSDEQIFWRIYLSEHKPQIWGTLSIGNHTTGAETLNLCNRLLIKAFNKISQNFSKSRQYFVRAVFSDQLHFHFYLWFRSNPHCNFRQSKRSHLKAVKVKEYAEPYFSSSNFFDPIKKEFPFPEADLDVQFYKEEKGHAELYGTGPQKHDAKKLLQYDTSNFSGTEHFLYSQNVFRGEKRKAVNQENFFVESKRF